MNLAMVMVLVGCGREASISQIPREPIEEVEVPEPAPPGTTDTGGLAPETPYETPTDIDTKGCGAYRYPQVLNQCGGAVAVVANEGFASVQSAIDAAPARDPVFVCPGTWSESLLIRDRTVEIFAADPSPSATVLTGDGARIVVETRGGDVTLQGLEIRNGFSTYAGGGIASEETALTLRCVTVADNLAEYEGGGLHASGGPVTIEDSTFENNTSLYEGGAIEFDNGFAPMDATVRGTTFTANRAAYSGAAIAIGSWSRDVVVIENSQFIENQSLNEGGAISAGSWDSVELTIASSGFFDNTADNVGGALALGTDGDVDVTITNSQFGGGNARSGGAIYVSSRVNAGQVTLTDVSITESTSLGTSAAVDVQSGTTLSCTNCDLGDGVTDNDPNDVRVGGAVVNEGAGATFVLP